MTCLDTKNYIFRFSCANKFRQNNNLWIFQVELGHKERESREKRFVCLQLILIHFNLYLAHFAHAIKSSTSSLCNYTPTTYSNNSVKLNDKNFLSSILWLKVKWTQVHILWEWFLPGHLQYDQSKGMRQLCQFREMSIKCLQHFNFIAAASKIYSWQQMALPWPNLQVHFLKLRLLFLFLW